MNKRGRPAMYKGKCVELYTVWRNMCNRCLLKNNPAYKNYGKRGIKVCKQWLTFEQFEVDMSPTYKKGLTIDRIDNNKGYSKDNCRWATRKEQNRNVRHNVKYKGEYMTDAVKRLGGASGLITMRLRYGWSLKKAFTKAINRSNKLTKK